jgi:predicted nucleic acid-binding protein
MNPPTAFVLDASVTAAWLLPDEHTQASQRAYALLRSGTVDVHAPEGWLWECGNLIASGVRSGRIDKPDALLLWNVLDAVRTRVELAVLEPAQVRACLQLAMDSGLSLHDASTLWLAASLRIPLLTHDADLTRAAAAHRVQTLRVEDLA